MAMFNTERQGISTHSLKKSTWCLIGGQGFSLGSIKIRILGSGKRSCGHIIPDLSDVRWEPVGQCYDL